MAHSDMCLETMPLKIPNGSASLRVTGRGASRTFVCIRYSVVFTILPRLLAMAACEVTRFLQFGSGSHGEFCDKRCTPLNGGVLAELVTERDNIPGNCICCF